jgi:hypothetical protein
MQGNQLIKIQPGCNKTKLCLPTSTRSPSPWTLLKAGLKNPWQPVNFLSIRFLGAYSGSSFIWWLAFMGIYASSSVCPFCGQAGCPVGVAGAGLVGGFFALVIGQGKVFLSYFNKMFSRIRTKLKLILSRRRP